MIALAFLAVVLSALAVASMRWGVDSREDSSDPRRSEYPVGIS